MSAPIVEGVSTNETGDETHSLTGHKPGNLNIANSSLSTPVTSEEVARRYKAATDQLTKQFEGLLKQ